ncbi:MAG: primosomal protein N' [Spirochaetaceae bacterium]|jgi:primosomal protein N' (replication factor Y)|nr:primosomal protein N' [Spirochaetaceae bacterium]
MDKRYCDLAFAIPVKQTFTYSAEAATLHAGIGKRCLVSFGRRTMMGYIIGERDTAPSELDPAVIKPIQAVVDQEPLFDSRTIALAQWMADFYLCSIGEALRIMLPSARRLPREARPLVIDEMTDAAPLLSHEQRRAVDAITGAQGAESFYLYGITGSGKTEVFLCAAEALLNTGKSVIYLVPEIALTQQTQKAVRKRFGDSAAMIHSGLSTGVKLKEWMRILNGEARIVVGPRSAVFAPVQNLGLIVIDEEHDSSYKSGETPRYHARQVAMRRCSVAGARLVLGSATPSVEAWYMMAQGRMSRLNLTKRLSGGALPRVRAVSLEHTGSCLTDELKEALRQTAQMGKQSILFLNRRGFAHFYYCHSCGYRLACKHCSIALTYHKDRSIALCHYCGYQTTIPVACPQCGSLEAGFRSFGTEMIAEELQRTFPELRICRADSDTTGTAKKLEETLSRFREGAFDILLGTQMVAKGLNFPGVRLVGVVFADTGLSMPDFRAAERGFSLIVQVAGRSGRFSPDGQVIVQTFRPHDPLIIRATALDVEGFLNSELAIRKITGFPPYNRLIRFTMRAKEKARVEAAVAHLATLVKPLLPADADMLGPAECPINRIAENYRHHLILRGHTMGTLHAAARRAQEQYAQEKDSRVYGEIDVDPVALL